jgi:serine/threonine protein kinase/tetratricopeptide (TPR) repeat protein
MGRFHDYGGAPLKCPHCGASAAQGASCPQCGRIVPKAQAFVATLTPTPDPGQTQPGDTRPGDADETRLSPSPDTTGLPGSPARRAASPLGPGDAFGPRYRILRVLGAGGMGVVYHAWDNELGEAVALKLIRDEVSGDPALSAELHSRFKRELLLARKVSHRNVVRIHDIGEVDGTKYISMSYVEGRDLATTLKTTGHLPVDRVVHFIKQMAAGLLEAHQAGVIHRDLKPANIMVEGDELLIMDFGIARSAVPGIQTHVKSGTKRFSRSDLITGQTVQGAIVGTVAYMSPEQAKGQPADERSDIYSLGMVMRDMLVGMRSVHSPTDAVDDLLARIDHAPPSVQTLDPTIPDDVARIVSRCLQPEPAARFQSVDELLAALNHVHAGLKPLKASNPVNKWVLTAVAVLVLALPLATLWLTRTPPPPVEHDPVSVIIADFHNGTGDPTFDRTLEPMLKIAMEDAGFVSAYDRSVVSRSLGVKPPELMDERAAREIAVKEGLGVVLAGSLVQQGGQYVVSLKAIHAVTGNEIAAVEERASSRTQVLAAATNLASAVRSALGDDTSESNRRFAMETLSATSLEVVREYAAAAESMSRAQYDAALQSFAKAVALDPEFGLGYAGLAIASRNLDRQQDAERYIKEAVSHLGSMTERERYRTRGLFYMITSDYQQCVKEFGDLIARYAADTSARNNLALCSTYLRDLPRAVEEMRKVIKILPKRALYRENLALYEAYSGDAAAAEQEVRGMPQQGLFGLLALGFAQLLQSQYPEAAATYESLAKFDDLGASYSASGLGDLAVHQGRFSDAVDILTRGAAADLASKDPDRAANKYAALAHAQLLRGNKAAAVAAAETALKHSTAVKIRFLAAHTLVEADAPAKAEPLATALSAALQAEPRAYARIIDGLKLLKAGDARRAVGAFGEANALLDTWIGHFDLGRAYLEAGALTQADSEFDRCIKRRGEALSLFLDEEPTFGYFPPVYYYQGRVRQGLKSTGADESYQHYLDIRGQSSEDPLVPDVRRRNAS